MKERTRGTRKNGIREERCDLGERCHFSPIVHFRTSTTPNTLPVHTENHLCHFCIAKWLLAQKDALLIQQSHVFELRHPWQRLLRLIAVVVSTDPQLTIVNTHAHTHTHTHTYTHTHATHTHTHTNTHRPPRARWQSLLALALEDQNRTIRLMAAEQLAMISKPSGGLQQECALLRALEEDMGRAADEKRHILPPPHTQPL